MRPFRQRGFSLLEMLVALLIIVLATSLVTLNINTGNEDKRLDSAVRQLTETANYALDEAQFTGMDYGLQFSAVSERGIPHYHWRWRERGPEGWREPASGKEVFAEGDLPEGVELQLTIEDVIQPRDVLDNGSDATDPQLILYSSGETPPGSLDVRAGDRAELRWRVEWSALGDFRALPKGVEPAPEESQ